MMLELQAVDSGLNRFFLEWPILWSTPN